MLRRGVRLRYSATIYIFQEKYFPKTDFSFRAARPRPKTNKGRRCSTEFVGSRRAPPPYLCFLGIPSNYVQTTCARGRREGVVGIFGYLRMGTTHALEFCFSGGWRHSRPSFRFSLWASCPGRGWMSASPCLQRNVCLTPSPPTHPSPRQLSTNVQGLRHYIFSPRTLAKTAPTATSRKFIAAKQVYVVAPGIYRRECTRRRKHHGEGDRGNVPPYIRLCYRSVSGRK